MIKCNFADNFLQCYRAKVVTFVNSYVLGFLAKLAGSCARCNLYVINNTWHCASNIAIHSSGRLVRNNQTSCVGSITTAHTVNAPGVYSSSKEVCMLGRWVSLRELSSRLVSSSPKCDSSPSWGSNSSSDSSSCVLLLVWRRWGSWQSRPAVLSTRTCNNEQEIAYVVLRYYMETGKTLRDNGKILIQLMMKL